MYLILIYLALNMFLVGYAVALEDYKEAIIALFIGVLIFVFGFLYAVIERLLTDTLVGFLIRFYFFNAYSNVERRQLELFKDYINRRPDLILNCWMLTKILERNRILK